MLQDELKSILIYLINDKEAFKTFCKTKYFPYLKSSSFEGSISIVNEEAILSFLQEVNNNSKVIATANFQHNGSIILKLDNTSFSEHQFDWENSFAENFGVLYAARIHNSNRDTVINQINSIRKYCAEAKEKSSTTSSKSIFNKLINQLKPSDKILSKEDVKALLEDTLSKLNRTQTIESRNKLSPKHNISTIISNNNISFYNLEYNNIR